MAVCRDVLLYKYCPLYKKSETMKGMEVMISSNIWMENSKPKRWVTNRASKKKKIFRRLFRGGLNATLAVKAKLSSNSAIY